MVSRHRVFPESRVIASSYLRGSKIFLEGISWVQDFLLWVDCGSKSFFRGYFVGSKLSLVSILWVQDFFSWVICGSNAFFLVGMFWVQNYFSWVFSWVQSFFSWRNTCYIIIVSNFSTHPLQRSKYHVEKKGDQT